MTEQYSKTNINGPRNPTRTVISDTQLNLDDLFIVVDSTAGPVTITMPEATQIPSWECCIKSLNGGVNPVTIVGAGGQTIDGGASVSLDIDNTSVTLFSDGDNWQSGATGSAVVGAGGFIIDTGSLFQTEGAGVVAVPDPIVLPLRTSRVTNTLSDEGIAIEAVGLAVSELTVLSITLVVSGTATIPTDSLSVTVIAGPLGGPFVAVGTAGPVSVAPDTIVTVPFASAVVPAGQVYSVLVTGVTIGSIGPADETYTISASIHAII